MGSFGLEVDHEKAFELFKKGCEHGLPDSCYNVAFSYQQGDGTQMNYDKAIEFYTKACDLGFSYACGNLGVLYVGGSQNVKQDLRKALDYFVRACDLGNEKICEKLQWIKDTISIDQPQN